MLPAVTFFFSGIKPETSRYESASMCGLGGWLVCDFGERCDDNGGQAASRAWAINRTLHFTSKAHIPVLHVLCINCNEARSLKDGLRVGRSDCGWGY